MIKKNIQKSKKKTTVHNIDQFPLDITMNIIWN